MNVFVGAAAILVSSPVEVRVIVYRPEGKFHVAPLLRQLQLSLGKRLASHPRRMKSLRTVQCLLRRQQSLCFLRRRPVLPSRRRLRRLMLPFALLSRLHPQRLGLRSRPNSNDHHHDDQFHQSEAVHCSLATRCCQAQDESFCRAVMSLVLS